MIAVNDVTRDAVKFSHATRTVVDVYDNGILTYPQVPVTGWKVSANRSDKARLNADVTLALQPWEATRINAKTSRFVVRHGLDVVGADGLIELGEYRVDQVGRGELGMISLKGAGLENYVMDARFVTPRTPPYGVSTTGQIADLIREVLPGARVVTRNTRNKPVQATAPWEKERWDAVDALAESINTEVFADHTGTFVIADAPLMSGVPVMVFDEGDGGLLVSRSQEETRGRVYNAVSVSGSSTDSTVPPVWGWAYDSDPSSPTYYYGAFGQVPRFYTSQFFTTDAQCADYAQSLLMESLAENKTIKFTGFPLVFLEVGDVVGVRDYEGAMEVHLVQTTEITDGELTVETLSVKSLIADGT